MASKQELYVSITPKDYKENKSNILTSQADLLVILKRLHNLKVLARQKNDLKKRLYKLLSSTLSCIGSIQEEMPASKLPKSIQKEKEFAEVKEYSSNQDDIEDELKLIQKKLRELNS